MAQIVLTIDDALVPRVRAAFRNMLDNQLAGLPEIKQHLINEIKRVVKVDEVEAALRTARQNASNAVDSGVVIT